MFVFRFFRSFQFYYFLFYFLPFFFCYFPPQSTGLGGTEGLGQGGSIRRVGRRRSGARRRQSRPGWGGAGGNDGDHGINGDAKFIFFGGRVTVPHFSIHFFSSFRSPFCQILFQMQLFIKMMKVKPQFFSPSTRSPRHGILPHMFSPKVGALHSAALLGRS